MGNYKHKNTEKKERNDSDHRFLWELFWSARSRTCLQTIYSVTAVLRPRGWAGRERVRVCEHTSCDKDIETGDTVPCRESDSKTVTRHAYQQWQGEFWSWSWKIDMFDQIKQVFNQGDSFPAWRTGIHVLRKILCYWLKTWTDDNEDDPKSRQVTQLSSQMDHGSSEKYYKSRRSQRFRTSHTWHMSTWHMSTEGENQ